MLLKPNFRSALFNLALLLSDTGRPLEAVPFLKQLVHHHQDHIKGLILLGDIYINSMKDLEAAEGVILLCIQVLDLFSNCLFCALAVLHQNFRAGSDECTRTAQSVRCLR